MPNRALRLASAGFIAVYGLNLLAGGVLVPSRPLGTLINPRYWIQYFPFIALVIGGLVAVVAGWVARRVQARGDDPRRASRAGVATALVLAVLVCVVPDAARGPFRHGPAGLRGERRRRDARSCATTSRGAASPSTRSSPTG